MKYLTIALAAFLWLNTYSIPSGTSPYRPVLTLDRAAYALRVSKPALPAIIQMNNSFAISPSTRVYGIWMEDYRAYCDFPLIGSIYGYGSHLELADTPIWEVMEATDCRYLIYDVDRIERTSPYFGGEPWLPDVKSYGWRQHFEQCYDLYPMYEYEDGTSEPVCPSVRVWRLR